MVGESPNPSTTVCVKTERLDILEGFSSACLCHMACRAIPLDAESSSRTLKPNAQTRNPKSQSQSPYMMPSASPPL